MVDARQDSTGGYPFLMSLDMDQLESLLKTDYSGSMSEQASEGLIDAIIEVMLEKEKEDPSGRFPDTEKAWADFQTYYNIPGRKHPHLSPVPAVPVPLPSQATRPRRSRRLLRWCALVAAVIGLFMALLVAAQAAGLDVFGSMARWTDETFHFVTAPANDETAELRAVLREQGFPEEYAPTWIPEGFCADTTQVFMSQKTKTASALFSDDTNKFQFSITQLPNKARLPTFIYEKDAKNVLPYSNGHQVFYIFDNLESCVATWSDGEELTIMISGQLSVKDMKSILDSIGGKI